VYRTPPFRLGANATGSARGDHAQPQRFWKMQVEKKPHRCLQTTPEMGKELVNRKHPAG